MVFPVVLAPGVIGLQVFAVFTAFVLFLALATYVVFVPFALVLVGVLDRTGLQVRVSGDNSEFHQAVVFDGLVYLCQKAFDLVLFAVCFRQMFGQILYLQVVGKVYSRMFCHGYV